MIRFDVLGRPGYDNALWVEVDSGQSIDSLLFDCGEACLYSKETGQVQAARHLFFSHLHMDHVGGFDTYFRTNFNRGGEFHIWGPPQTAEIIQHRMRGYWWNFSYDDETWWVVHEVHPGFIRTTRFSLREHFRHAHESPAVTWHNPIVSTKHFTVDVALMDHKGVSLAYVVREEQKFNVDMTRLAALGLRPGPWVKVVKESTQSTVSIDGVEQSVAELRSALLVETPGDSIAYVTDLLPEGRARATLVRLMRGCTTVVCEAAYHPDHHDMAVHNTHMTPVIAAELARDAEAGRLILIHLSSRYTTEEWRTFLPAAKAVFERSTLPDHWKL